MDDIDELLRRLQASASKAQGQDSTTRTVDERGPRGRESTVDEPGSRRRGSKRVSTAAYDRATEEMPPDKARSLKTSAIKSNVPEISNASEISPTQNTEVATNKFIEVTTSETIVALSRDFGSLRQQVDILAKVSERYDTQLKDLSFALNMVKVIGGALVVVIPLLAALHEIWHPVLQLLGLAAK
jgi:hypothetical protein